MPCSLAGSSYSSSSIPLLYLPRLHAFFAVDPRGDQPVFPTPSPRLSRRGYPDNTRGASKFFRMRASQWEGRDEETEGGRFGWYAITTIKCDTRGNATVRYHFVYNRCATSSLAVACVSISSIKISLILPKSFGTDLIRAKLTGTRLVLVVLI